MNPQDEAVARLLEQIEKQLGREMKTPKDFDFLAEQIFVETKQKISASTLKRIWGYIDPYKSIRETTLDLLAQFAGYDNFQLFCLQAQPSQVVFTPPVKNIYIAERFPA